MKHASSLITRISLTILLLFPLSITAGTIDIGAKVGISAADQSYNYTASWISVERVDRFGIAAGMFADYQIGRFTSLRLELNYVQKGSGIEVRVGNERSPDISRIVTFDDRIDYLSVSLLAIQSPSMSWHFSPYLIVGPRIDILLSTSSFFPSPILDSLKTTVLGSVIGAGVKIPAYPAVSIFLEVSYNHDFSDAFETSLLSVKNRSFQLVAGIVF